VTFNHHVGGTREPVTIPPARLALDTLIRTSGSIVRELTVPGIVERLLLGAREVGGEPDVRVLVGSGDAPERGYRLDGDQVVELSAAGPGLDGGEYVIRAKDGRWGVLWVVPRPIGDWQERIERDLRTLCRAAGIAVDNARIHAESELRARWLRASTEVTRELLTADSGDPLALVVSHAAAVAHADAAGIALRSGPDDVEVKCASAGMEYMLGKHLPATPESLGGRALRSRNPVSSRGPFPIAASLAVRDLVEVVAAPLVASTDVLGLLYAARTGPDAQPFTPAELDMIGSFANQAALALELAHNRANQDALERAEERERIAGDLHDHVIQQLLAVGMGLAGVADNSADPVMAERLEGFVGSIEATITGIRNTIAGMRDAGWADHRALPERLAEVVDGFAEVLHFFPKLDLSGPLYAIADVQLIDDAVAVAREALSNAARHANADLVELSVSLDAGLLTLQVTDDGRGIGRPQRSSGLSSMRRRALEQGGTFEALSPATGGTTVIWQVPCVI
jgi:signal transduction histidine kinase